jgi:uncharacterized protein DUF1629
MMAYSVFTLSGAKVRGAALLDEPRALAKVRMDQGESLVKKIKPGTTFSFHPDYPNGRTVLDAFANAFGGFPVSPKVKEIFEAEPSIEFIPIKIADHRKKVVATDYVLANPLGLVDCIDMKKSEVVMDSLDPTEIFGIDKLVLMPGKIPKDRHVFRVVGRPSMLLLSPKIMKAIEAAKPTGVECFPADGFSNLGKIGV